MSDKVKFNDNCIMVSKKYLDSILQDAIFKGNKVNISGIEAYQAVDNFKDNVGYLLVSEEALRELINKADITGTTSNEEDIYRDAICILADSLSDTNKKVETLANLFKHEKENVDSLKKENKSLKEAKSSVVSKDMQKQHEIVVTKLKEANSEIKRLKEELAKMRGTLQEKDNNVANLQKEIDTLKSSAKERMSNARQVKMKKSDQIAAMIISLAVQRYDVGAIQQILSDKDIKIATIYRALSVREDVDRERVLKLYTEYPETFQGVSKEDLIKWFETNRIKKLHLISKEDFIKKYGETALPEKDKYITEDYYSIKDM